MADVSLLFNILARDNTAGGLNSASSRMDKFRAAVSVAAVGILGAAAVMGKKAVEIASDTSESTSKVNALLDSSSTAALKFAETSAAAFGMSKREALGAVGNMAAVDRAMGTSAAEAAKLAVEYTKLSADLGSFNNASSADVQEALTASLAGEYEMLKRYGIVVNDVTLAQEAARIGMKKTGATWDSAQKRQLSYNIIMASTKAAQGDFARTQGGLANQTKIAAAQFEDLQGKIGAKLLPAAVKVMGVFVQLLGWLERHQTAAKVLGIAVLTLGTAIVTTAIAMKAYAAGQAALIAVTRMAMYAQLGLNTAFLANPITWVILGLVALGVAFVVLWRKSETFRKIVTGAFNAVKGAASAAWSWIRGNWPKLVAILFGPFGIAFMLISKNMDRIKGAVSGAVSWITGRFRALLAFFRGIPGSIGSALASVTDKITAPFRKALDMVQGIMDRITGLAGKIPGAGKVGGLLGKIPGFAAGTMSAPGGLAIVGERGPELVELPRGSRVTPNHALRQAGARTGGGEQVVRVVLDVTGGDHEFRQMVKAWARAGGRTA